MTLFEGRDLTCQRGQRQVFTGLDFALAPGGTLLLTGANGSGKSSLLRVMAGLLRPVAGQLTWAGEKIVEDPESHNARVQYLGHQDAVKPVLTAAENLSFWAGLRGYPGADAQQALARLGLGHLAEVPGRMLSAGQKRRLALARLLVSPAEIWLLDEPSVGVDEASLDSLGAEIARHLSDGGRIVAATHVRLPIDDAETLPLGEFSGGPAPEMAW
jgi:heme exporter protein A